MILEWKGYSMDLVPRILMTFKIKEIAFSLLKKKQNFESSE